MILRKSINIPESQEMRNSLQPEEKGSNERLTLRDLAEKVILLATRRNEEFQTLQTTGSHLSDRESLYSKLSESSYNKLYRTELCRELDQSQASYIKEWFTEKAQNGQQNFAITVGSYGSDEQCNPTFTKSEKNVAILNIDRCFNENEYRNSSDKNNTKMKLSLSEEKFPITHQVLNEEIENIIKNNQNKCVITVCTSPIGFNFFEKLIKKNTVYLGKNLAYVQSYFDFYPSANLNAEFFTTDKGSQEDLIVKVWNSENFAYTFDEKKNTDDAFKSYSSPERHRQLSETINNFNNNQVLSKFGRFYTGLKEIKSISELFNNKTMQLDKTSEKESIITNEFKKPSNPSEITALAIPNKSQPAVTLIHSTSLSTTTTQQQKLTRDNNQLSSPEKTTARPKPDYKKLYEDQEKKRPWYKSGYFTLALSILFAPFAAIFYYFWQASRKQEPIQKISLSPQELNQIRFNRQTFKKAAGIKSYKTEPSLTKDASQKKEVHYMHRSKYERIVFFQKQQDATKESIKWLRASKNTILPTM
jgi:hypothetical protein